jgi:hypothetical protein
MHQSSLLPLQESPAPSFAGGRNDLLQRKSDRAPARSPSPPEAPSVVQEPRFGHSFADFQVHPDAGAVRHNGLPLDGSARSAFESRFQQDFSRVRVHTGSSAHALQGENANAATLGHDIFFAPGRYAPHHPEGQRLLAHELTHVVQQNLPGATSPSANHETEAASVAHAFSTSNARLRPRHAAARKLQFDKGYPKTVKISNADVVVASQAEETEANKLITDIKSIYNIDFDSPKGLQAVKDKVVGDPDQPQTVSQMLGNEPRHKVKDLLQTSSWTLAQLRAVKHGLSYYSPVLGMARSFSTRSTGAQELTSISRLNTNVNKTHDATDSSVQGEYFSSSGNASIFDSANAGTELADKTKSFEGTVVHEAAHALLGYGKSEFVTKLSPRYWKDADTSTNDAIAEKPVTTYGTKNAGEDLADAAMFYFLERSTLQSKCPQRDRILDSLVKGWATPSPGPGAPKP